MLNLFESELDSESCYLLRITQSDQLIKRFFRVLILLPSFLCLDAAFVALGWSRFLAFDSVGVSEPVPIAPTEWGLTIRETALFLSVWVIYLFDRLYDTRRHSWSGANLADSSPFSTSSDSGFPLRHQFAIRHSKWLLMLFLVGVLLLGLLSPQLEGSDWLLGLWVGVGVFGYFILFRFAKQLRGTQGLVSHFPAKETALAVFFTFGVLGAAERFEGSPHPWIETFLIGAAFALLVLSDCLLIAYAERKFDRDHDTASYFSRRKSPGMRIVFSLLAIVLLISVSLATLFGESTTGLILAGSATGLILVHLSSLPSRYRQPVFDAILLLPWIPLLFFS
ncbi:MAG: hypothetical protein P1U85_03050 [Verrucomicrobiales bacterium]|nr:hypothetical protein [Verrucomicrobiales bacterium]